MKNKTLITSCILMFLFASTKIYAEKIDNYSVTWNSQSQNASGSMPVDNGDLTANVWVEKNGKQVILPAQKFSRHSNVENPELYAIFPYKLYGIEKEELDIAINTLDERKYKTPVCWSQDLSQMALLGLTDQAAEYALIRSDEKQHSTSRFPAFWNEFNDYVPDMDHGGNLLMGVNFMLMQSEGDQIRLLPAWPKDWSAEFKLHAPGNTTVEGVVKNGKLEKLKVTPESRTKDIQLIK